MTFYITYDPANFAFKGFYNTEVSSVIPTPNVALTDQQHAEAYASINSGRSYAIGPVSIHPLVVVERPATWDDVRSKRDGILKSTDWTQLADAPAGSAAKYAAYRTALRNLPATFKSPDSVVWPTKPV